MYVQFLIIISVLSIFPIGEKIASFILKKRKIISNIIYFLCFASLLFITDTNTIHETGEYSIWLLWVLLFLPILSKVFNLSIPRKLMIFRKEIGILMGVMAFVHSLQYFIVPYAYMFWELNFWVYNGIPTHLSWGMIGTIIAVILTITSNNWSIKKMGGKGWKLLHRSVYALIILSLMHVYIFKMGPKFEIEAFVREFGVLFIYFVGKIFEWRGKRVDLKNYITKLINRKSKGIVNSIKKYKVN